MATPAKASRLRRLGAVAYRELPVIDAVAITATERDLSRIARLPYVERISSDTTTVKNDEFVVQGTMMREAQAAYPGLDGSNVTVAVLDSGIRENKDLNVAGTDTSRVIASVNFSNSLTADDRSGHGTHVAGIVAGNGAASTGVSFFRTFLGVATGTKLASVKVLNDQGEGTSAPSSRASTGASRTKPEHNIRVMNLSLGHPVGESYETDPLCQALEQAWKAGIFVVCSAGNEGRASGSPGGRGQRRVRHRLRQHPELRATALT